MYCSVLVRSEIYSGKIRARGGGNCELSIMYMNRDEDLAREANSISVWVSVIVQSLFSPERTNYIIPASLPLRLPKEIDQGMPIQQV